ncbi:MAG: PD-(D/E)XK nuclease family protein [Acholeplasmatales bacterium]|nr:PD-(D/E)XK nuclease family protein [Acholeplasmatales bacterium]
MTLTEIKFSEDLLDLDIEIDDSTYEYNGVIVPRVTKILSATLDSNALIKWAGNIPPSMYNNISDGAKRIGTEVHAQIDRFLNDPTNKDFFFYNNLLSSREEDKVITALNNFKSWYYNIHDWGYKIEEIVGLEIPITCPWYGGTIDGIVKINGAYYIIDFKTSKKIVLEHVLQTSAYMWAINNGYTPLPHIDGIGIIRVDKAIENKYDDLFLTEVVPEQGFYINQFQRCFCSLVDSYYRSIYSENIFKEYSTNYNFTDAMTG